MALIGLRIAAPRPERPAEDNELGWRVLIAGVLITAEGLGTGPARGGCRCAGTTGTDPPRIRPGLCFIPPCGHKKCRNALLRAANTPKPHSKGLQKDSILSGLCGRALWPETTASRAPSWQVAGCVTRDWMQSSPAMESTWQPLVSLPAGWEQLCSTQTPPGSALPLAPCLPHTSPSATSCPQQEQDPRTPLQEPPEVSRGPSSRPLCVSTQGEEIWLYFHSQGTRSLAAGAIAGTRTAPCSRSSPAEARG